MYAILKNKNIISPVVDTVVRIVVKNIIKCLNLILLIKIPKKYPRFINIWNAPGSHQSPLFLKISRADPVPCMNELPLKFIMPKKM